MLRTEQIEIELANSNINSDYYNFDIYFIGVTDTKIRLTYDTIKLINIKCGEIVKIYKENYKDMEGF